MFLMVSEAFTRILMVVRASTTQWHVTGSLSHFSILQIWNNTSDPMAICFGCHQNLILMQGGGETLTADMQVLILLYAV